jgi:hypothetical protein
MQQRSQIPEADDKITIQAPIKGLTPGPTSSHLTRKEPKSIMNSFVNCKNTSSLTRIIEEELLSEMQQCKAIEERHGDLTLKLHETSTMWKTFSSTMTTDQPQGGLPQEEGDGEEHPQKFRTMI